MLVDTGYPEIFSQPNVTLVDVRADPIAEITATSVKTRDAEYPLDMLVLATGFDSGTGAVMRIDITGRNAVSLAQHWAAGPRTFLGVTIHGFPYRRICGAVRDRDYEGLALSTLDGSLPGAAHWSGPEGSASAVRTAI